MDIIKYLASFSICFLIVLGGLRLASNAQAIAEKRHAELREDLTYFVGKKIIRIDIDSRRELKIVFEDYTSLDLEAHKYDLEVTVLK